MGGGGGGAAWIGVERSGTQLRDRERDTQC